MCIDAISETMVRSGRELCESCALNEHVVETRTGEDRMELLAESAE